MNFVNSKLAYSSSKFYLASVEVIKVLGAISVPCVPMRYLWGIILWDATPIEFLESSPAQSCECK